MVTNQVRGPRGWGEYGSSNLSVEWSHSWYTRRGLPYLQVGHWLSGIRGGGWLYIFQASILKQIPTQDKVEGTWVHSERSLSDLWVLSRILSSVLSECSLVLSLVSPASISINQHQSTSININSQWVEWKSEKVGCGVCMIMYYDRSP